jgi:DUF917 family protein
MRHPRAGVLARVMLANEVVVAVGSAHVVCRAPVAASVLESVEALTTLHTDLTIGATLRAA